MKTALAPETEYFLERDLVIACTCWLKGDGWRGLQTEASYDPDLPRGKRGATFCSVVGMADCLYLRYDPAFTARAEVFWVEWKRYRSRPAQHQLDWHERERKRHAFTLIAGEDFLATVEGFKVWYRGSGLMRKPI